ncbi:S-adenosylmethionine:tRNA ribosyltransferase-isomerase [Nocardioides euryhalodurans]|uniref:S-adenosylmethionine:tRNA ribosyltransferase-isomerase n=1 Tax=Nocardioides euryhalodurans TaxID=2518370 RepID=A0A4V1BE54_9ACTN|nr:S-adenosylmethionine:tRNA ribosyltransferase-isomerase [Nocardioides euryhalodurans]QBR93432.1 S-adenosylmethionine:tRNA ribosyltransferase-isomerase [Nocardioides euryhalodurans]
MTTLALRPTTTFTAPGTSFAAGPPESRGLPRDGVRLLVASPAGTVDTRFPRLPEHLDPGDLLVVNDSAVVPGQLDGSRHPANGDAAGEVVLHVGSELAHREHVVELRTAPDAGRSVLVASPGDRVRVRGAELRLVAAYPGEGSSPTGTGNRLWRARVVAGDLAASLRHRGRPISYGYLDRDYPLAAYQSVFARTPGSVEMPSAGRPFSDAVLAALSHRGVRMAPVTLHTGFSSQEAGEAPQPEWYDVPAATARLVGATRAAGGRVVAVGTTATRALESAVARDGRVTASRGWTERVVTPAEPPRVVDGLVTGWHDPGASHLLLVEAVAGRDTAQAAYDVASTAGYLWHEFGDSALLLRR